MKVKKSKIKFSELPDTITPEIYSNWRGIGIAKARERFRSYGFPLIENCGANLIADKRAVFVYEFCTDEETKKSLMEKIAKKMFE